MQDATQGFSIQVRFPWVFASAGSNGAVAGGGPYELNSTATIHATGDPGYVFSGWSGEATGYENPLMILIHSDTTIAAIFSPDNDDGDGDGWTNYEESVVYGTNPDLADTDDDGLSDPDEIQTHLSNPNLADTDTDGLSDGAEYLTYRTNPKVGDTDGDGFLDGYEVLTGHLPLDILDKPALVAEARTAIEFTFPLAIGKSYRIEDSPDMTTWGLVEDGISGTGGVVTRFYTTRYQQKRFFRVEESP